MNHKLTITKCIGEIDYTFHINVTHFLSTQGTFSRQAETPDEFYGEQGLDYEILHVDYVTEDGCHHTFIPLNDDLESLLGRNQASVQCDICSDVWNAMIELQEQGE